MILKLNVIFFSQELLMFKIFKSISFHHQDSLVGRGKNEMPRITTYTQ